MNQYEDDMKEDSQLIDDCQTSSILVVRNSPRIRCQVIGLCAFTFSFGALISCWITWALMISQEAVRTPAVSEQFTYDMPVDPTSPLLQIDRNLSTRWFPAFNWTPDEWNEHPKYGRVDELWAEDMGMKNGFFLIPIEEGAQYSLDPRHNVVLRNVEGKYDGFPVMMEGIHQIHCLDALRRKLFMNRDWYKENWKHMADTELELAHTSHCLRMIREVIMCRADIGLVPWSWDRVDGLSPDFSRAHRCNNYSAILEFAKGQFMPKPVSAYMENLAPPADAQYLHQE
ncbi:hypothetical protein HBI52_232590 [Parastagonospora nodorum]|nr:hypothetical protein HBI52_232590 [Parastagonospora nodorum]